MKYHSKLVKLVDITHYRDFLFEFLLFFQTLLLQNIHFFLHLSNTSFNHILFCGLACLHYHLRGLFGSKFRCIGHLRSLHDVFEDVTDLPHVINTELQVGLRYFEFFFDHSCFFRPFNGTHQFIIFSLESFKGIFALFWTLKLITCLLKLVYATPTVCVSAR